MEIIVEHVRSFASLQRIPIRPLTLLVGDNSSGKTTFLSIVSAIFDAARFPASPGFNEPPYSLGTFDTIATYKGGKYGRDNEFSIGYVDDHIRKRSAFSAKATYGNLHGNVSLRRVVSDRVFKVSSPVVLT